MMPRRAIPPPAACQPAKQRTTSPRYRPNATRYGVAPIVNRLFRGVALRKRAELLQRNEETENLLLNSAVELTAKNAARPRPRDS